jgi:hypothetical protein
VASPVPLSTAATSLAPVASFEASFLPPPESLAVTSTLASVAPPPDDDVPAELPHAVRRTKSGTHRITRMVTLLLNGQSPRAEDARRANLHDTRASFIQPE